VDRIFYSKVFVVFDNTRIPRNNPNWNSQNYAWNVASGLVNEEFIGETEVSTTETQLQPHAGAS
jgi:hypothetical protein